MPVIVGTARSGTTLLRLMLDAHSEMCIPPETGFIPAAIKRSLGAADSRGEFFKTVVQFETWPDFNLSADEFCRVLKNIEPFDLAEGLRAFYRLYACRFRKGRWGDKTPIYCVHLHKVENVLPEARFIHVIRDGRDVALSVRGLWFSPGNDIESIALDWKYRIERARYLSRRSRHYLEVHYESLVMNPDHELGKICEFIELTYEPNMPRYFEKARERLDEVKTRYNPDGTVLITKDERLYNQRLTSFPPEPSRIFRWKHEMRDKEKEQFERAAGDMLRELGYETSRKTSHAYRWYCRVKNLARILGTK